MKKQLSRFLRVAIVPGLALSLSSCQYPYGTTTAGYPGEGNQAWGYNGYGNYGVYGEQGADQPAQPAPGTQGATGASGGYDQSAYGQQQQAGYGQTGYGQQQGTWNQPAQQPATGGWTPPPTQPATGNYYGGTGAGGQGTTGAYAGNYNYNQPAIQPPVAGTGGGGYAASRTYTVVGGDTLYGISRRFSTSVSNIRNANGISGDIIHPGQVLNIP